MAETKYACFKIDDWLDAWKKLEGSKPEGGFNPLHELQQKRLNDSVVIRLQDVFAAPALDAYANSITVAVNLINQNGGLLPEVREVVDRLQHIADYFHEMAVRAWEYDHKKLPD